VVSFDVLDFGKDELLELHGKSAKAGVQVVHLAAIRALPQPRVRERRRC
jgi:hypothetical protein